MQTLSVKMIFGMQKHQVMHSKNKGVRDKILYCSTQSARCKKFYT